MSAMTETKSGHEVRPYDPSMIYPDEPESPKEAASVDETWDYWKKQLYAGFQHERRWRAEAKEAEEIYFGDDKAGRATQTDEAATTKVNEVSGVIHSTIDVLKPMVYSKLPTPSVSRRFQGDGEEDPTDRMAAEVAQRLAEYHLDTTRFDSVMKRVRDDWLIPGRGMPRVHYKVEFETDVLTGERKKKREWVEPRHWQWRRILFSPADTWEDLRWIAYETFMTRKQVELRWGVDVARRLAYPHEGLENWTHDTVDDSAGWVENREPGSGDRTVSAHATTIIYEIWDREEKKVRYWCASDTAKIMIEEVDDPLELEGFFDCPEPLLATALNGRLDPRPDVTYYRRRADEISEASEKLNEILKVIAVAGLYAGEDQEIMTKLFSGKSQLIAVKNWLALMEKGGVTSAVQWLPLDNMVKAAAALQAMMENSKNALFEISGVSDIVRGQGDPNATATQEEIKGKYAGLRLGTKQGRMARMARDTLEIIVELVVEHFDVKTIAAICNLDLPLTMEEREQRQFIQNIVEQVEARAAQAQQNGEHVDPNMIAQMMGLPGLPEKEKVPETSWEEVMSVLRDDLKRKYSINIETDSTILTDESTDKDSRIEFLSAFSGMLEQLMLVATAGPFDFKLAKELLLFGVRGFRNARSLESMIAALPDEWEAEAPPPEVQVQVANIRAEVDRMVEANKAEMQKEEHSHEMRLKGLEIQADAAKAQIDDANRTEDRATSPQGAPA
ncbi:MAG: hypothetical protein AAGE80_05450 [Pseudomonadota bacterium]